MNDMEKFKVHSEKCGSYGFSLTLNEVKGIFGDDALNYLYSYNLEEDYYKMYISDDVNIFELNVYSTDLKQFTFYKLNDGFFKEMTDVKLEKMMKDYNEMIKNANILKSVFEHKSIRLKSIFK
jgi:hypothetical protein